ncbi:type IX secretion system periplasmic lipoprotein PorW/SprE [Aureibaculum algae]
MIKKFPLWLFISAFLLILISCSTKKNNLVSRNMHALSTKYNVLYNGQVAYDQAKLQLDDKYADNFWELLPIEPLKIEEDDKAILINPSSPPKDNNGDTESTATGFERAEEKAVKAIQKHGMDIKGKERNRQIDDAYLLLGKSRYYSQRFVPALEAFNFVLENYTENDLKDQTRVWQAKTLVRLQNEELAIETLQYLLKNLNLPLELVEDGHTTMAMAYQALDSTDLVIKHLDSAVLFSVDPKQKSRNLFILGQVYRNEQKIDSSNLYFEKLMNFNKAPLRYQVHAQIDRAKNYTKEDSTALFLARFKKLIKNRDNRPFLDELYYHKGLIESQNDSIKIGLEDFEKSLRAVNGIEYQKELTYEAIGNIYFDKAKFELAGAYYDSIIGITKNKNEKRIRRLVRKRESLEEVITYEALANTNDSILKIAALPKAAQEAFYQGYIDSIKKVDELAKIKLENALESTTGFGNLSDDSSKSSSKGGKFYFYNNNVAGFGKQEFKRSWGNRALEDNWRISAKKAISDNTKKTDLLVVEDNFDTSKKYELDYYISRIPTKKSDLDSITYLRNDAYYNLGIIYKEQFKEYPLAAERLEKLLTFNPVEKLILPINYHLYKIYANFDETKSNKYKNVVVSNYPESRYAKIILNPEKILAYDDANSPEAIYNDIYCNYDFQHYVEAYQKTEKAIERFKDEPIIPKLELLKAHILMKTIGAEAFKEALSFVALSYPNTEEGKRAVEILENFDSDSANSGQ